MSLLFRYYGLDLAGAFGVDYCSAGNNPVDSEGQMYSMKMRNCGGHNVVFIINDSSCAEESQRLPQSYHRAHVLKGNDIFAYVKPDHKTCKKSRDWDKV